MQYMHYNSATVTHVTGDASRHQRHLQICVLTVQIVTTWGKNKKLSTNSKNAQY